MARIAVILSGCGVFDGSEIYETTLTLLALDRRGAEVAMFAPDREMREVKNHLTGEDMAEERSILVEAARLARGKIAPLEELREADFDAVVFPGGFGAAKNLCDFAYAGADFSVNADMAAVVRAFADAGKPLGFLCIAPMVAAGVLGDRGVSLTIGNDPDTAAVIESRGARHVRCAVDDIAIDETNRVVSTPAYMYDEGLAKVADGIDKLIGKVLDWVG